MNTPSNTCAPTPPPFNAPSGPFTDERADHLREVLKRCPPSTYRAACQYRKTGNPECLPAIVLGIIERFVESDLRPKLRNPSDNLYLGEDLGLDSLTMMEIVMLAEDVLAITIRNDELRHLRTLGEVRQFIESKLRDQPAQNPSTC